MMRLKRGRSSCTRDPADGPQLGRHHHGGAGAASTPRPGPCPEICHARDDDVDEVDEVDDVDDVPPDRRAACDSPPGPLGFGMPGGLRSPRRLCLVMKDL